MADFVNMRPLPPWIGDVLRGGAAEWQEDPSAYVEAIEEHAVGPLAYARIPHPALREIALRAAAAELLRLEDLRTLLDGFARHGVPLLIIKGTALAYDIYEEPELRPRADTDLLIDRNDANRARGVFAELRYDARVLSGDPHANRQQAFARRDSFGVQHVYDLHWDIANTPIVRDALRFDELMVRSMALPRIAPAARAPSHVDALLLACIHRVAHHHDSDRLIWLYDIHLLHDGMTRAEHDEFWRRAAERRVVAICDRSIALAEEWFGRTSHDRAPAIPADEPSASFLQHDRSRGAVLAADLKALGWRARIERLRDLALPPRAFIRAAFPRAPRAALPLLYVYRGARGVWRLFRRI